jgi:hypothetical protein
LDHGSATIRISTLSRSIAADSLQVQRPRTPAQFVIAVCRKPFFHIVGAKISVCRGVNGMFAASSTIHDVERGAVSDEIAFPRWRPEHRCFDKPAGWRLSASAMYPRASI